MSVTEKYEIPLAGDWNATVAATHAVLVDLAGKVAAIEAATPAKSEAEKINPLETKYGEDNEGRLAAETVVRSILDPIFDYVDDDEGRTYHMAKAIDQVLGVYFRNEVSFYRNRLTPKVVGGSPNRKAEYKADYNELLKQQRHYAAIALTAGGLNEETSAMLDTSGKEPKSILTGFTGAGTKVDDGTVTGRYAKVYSLSWNIDGEDIDLGDGGIPSVVRLLWTGTDRVGRNAKSLTELLDKQAVGWMTTDFAEATFVVNDHEVTITRSAE